MIRFELKGEYIELIKLLKFEGVAESGAVAKQIVDEGIVKVNGSVESRKRAKLKKGDVIEIDEIKINIV